MSQLNEDGRSFHLLLMGEGTIKVRSLNPEASYTDWVEWTAPETHFVLYIGDLLPMQVILPPLHEDVYDVGIIRDRDFRITMAVAVNYRGHTVVEMARGQTLTIHDSPDGLVIDTKG